jgi:hypothetical protein
MAAFSRGCDEILLFVHAAPHYAPFDVGLPAGNKWEGKESCNADG